MKNIETEFPEFVNEVNNLTPEDLKFRIARLQQTLSESEQHKEDNDALKDARNELAAISAPYRDVKKAVKLKTAYILELLRSKVD